ncbi:hypothetical protein AOLI_G00318850 [Acnodon oligacanthus]
MSEISSSVLSCNNSFEAVIVPLEDGLCSINRVYKALIDEDIGLGSNYDYIREQIAQAKKSLEQSEHAAITELTYLDGKIEILTRDEAKHKRQLHDTKQALDNLQTEQASNENMQKESEHALEEARKNLNSTRDTLEKQKERKHKADIMTGVGAGVFFVPFYGWAIGLGMMIGGGVKINQASHAIKAADEEVKRSESQVEMFESNVSENESKISRTEQKIRQTQDEMEQIHEEIQKVKKQRLAVAEFQSKVRRAVHVLSGLSGKARVAEIETRRLILQEPVTKVMEDLMKSAGEITGNQLLSAEGIPKLLSEIKENNRKLAAICNSPSSDEDEGYWHLSKCCTKHPD